MRQVNSFWHPPTRQVPGTVSHDVRSRLFRQSAAIYKTLAGSTNLVLDERTIEEQEQGRAADTGDAHSVPAEVVKGPAT